MTSSGLCIVSDTLVSFTTICFMHVYCLTLINYEYRYECELLIIVRLSYYLTTGG